MRHTSVFFEVLFLYIFVTMRVGLLTFDVILFSVVEYFLLNAKSCTIVMQRAACNADAV